MAVIVYSISVMSKNLHISVKHLEALNNIYVELINQFIIYICSMASRFRGHNSYKTRTS
jgi:hypothetical protein